MTLKEENKVKGNPDKKSILHRIENIFHNTCPIDFLSGTEIDTLIDNIQELIYDYKGIKNTSK